MATTRVAPEKADFRPALSSRLLAGLLPEKAMAKMTYAEQLRHPNWQRVRLTKLNEANWKCEECGQDKDTLHVHHKRYVRGRMAWEYDAHELLVLCSTCHSSHHRDEEILKEMLMFVSMTEAVGLIGGYEHYSDYYEEGFLEQARQSYPIAYTCGFVARMLSALEIRDIRDIAEIVAKRLPSNAEVKLIYESSRDLFGEDD